MEFSAQQIANLLNGEIEGDENSIVTNLSKIEQGAPKTLSFLSNPAYTNYIYTTDASIVIVNKTLVLDKPVKSTCTLIRVENSYEAFAKLLELYSQTKGNKVGIEQPSFISPNATLGTDCYIGAFAYIGQNVTIGKNVKLYPHVYIGDHVTIGDNTTLFSGVKVYHECIIGANCTVHASTVIGSDGFGFAPNNSGESFAKVPQIGNVIIEDNVEIGSNASIDRATLGSTILHKGVKLDNLVQIAHNAEIGENTVIAGLTGVAGSSKVGKNCMIGAQVGVAGHLRIADGVKIAGQSGIGSNIDKEGEIVQGSPAFSIGDYKRSYVLFRGLPKLSAKISDLSKRLDSK
ncbi:UDP-3-O-(3-hydroxymyristoyl)glucosamine N-acyltransferase [Aurantibacillus circumpalustris]|uniref:UDP-3-O-(3-hydroxymyristoyl)glucosamine N-acyltransferase n=1 Tax=Aurantibacillus circumpalustris TaxID=3036359 RepID=UPI00295C1170|nr:UDP-3-O-(3-hydroxymyristoyl)glucosamine N-acyltransferase [Aurantibacillus circumpalustris]